MPRLFVAIELPDPLKTAIRELQSGLPNARWLNADGLHLTLAFIGDVDDETQHRIGAGLNNVRATEFSMDLRRLGHFPPRGAPRVLWVGAAPEVSIVALAEVVRSTLRNIGLAIEHRKFLPHVTIARFRQRPPGAEFRRFLAENGGLRTSLANIASFHLFSSTLQSAGAYYRIEQSFPLAGVPRE